jgi:hypothetical protein
MLKQLDLINEFNKAEDDVYKVLRDCKICIQAKTVKRQNYKAVPRAL